MKCSICKYIILNINIGNYNIVIKTKVPLGPLDTVLYGHCNLQSSQSRFAH